MKIYKQLFEEYLKGNKNKEVAPGVDGFRVSYGKHFTDRIKQRMDAYPAVKKVFNTDFNRFVKDLIIYISSLSPSYFNKIIDSSVSTLDKQKSHDKGFRVWFITEIEGTDKILFYRVPLYISRMYISPKFQRDLAALSKYVPKYNDLTDKEKEEVSILVDSLNSESGFKFSYMKYRKMNPNRGALYPLLGVTFLTFVAGVLSKEEFKKEISKPGNVIGRAFKAPKDVISDEDLKAFEEGTKKKS